MSQGKAKIAVIFVTIGPAAEGLKGGRTAYNGFKLPVSVLDTSTSSTKVSSSKTQKLNKKFWEEPICLHSLHKSFI
jgi:hypothetical protein